MNMSKDIPYPTLTILEYSKVNIWPFNNKGPPRKAENNV